MTKKAISGGTSIQVIAKVAKALGASVEDLAK
jgi:hypothetical protein